VFPNGTIIPSALDTRIPLDGPYDAEIAAFGTISIAGGGLLSWLGGGGVVAFMFQSHAIDTMMWGVLGEEINGYDMPLDVL